MRKPLSACFVLVLGTAAAQPALDGTWNATFSTGGSEARLAEIRISGTSGTWTTRARAGKDKHDPCVGRPLPITVGLPEPGKVTIELRASAEMSGCKDRRASLTIGPAGDLAGKLDNGHDIRLTR